MANAGQKVKVHYVGTLDDGLIFDSSVIRNEPIEFIAGSGQVIPGFDAAILSMEVGEKRKIHIPAAEAYGEYSEEFIEGVPLEQIPNSDQLPVGEYIVFPSPDGTSFRTKVLRIEDGKVFFDHNHELAGQNLNFDLELIEATDASQE